MNLDNSVLLQNHIVRENSGKSDFGISSRHTGSK